MGIARAKKKHPEAAKDILISKLVDAAEVVRNFLKQNPGRPIQEGYSLALAEFDNFPAHKAAYQSAIGSMLGRRANARKRKKTQLKKSGQADFFKTAAA